jgi:hypothetical protein
MSTIARALTLVLLLAGALPASTLAQAVPASEVEARRGEIRRRQERLERLEQAQKAPAPPAPVTPAAPPAPPAVASPPVAGEREISLERGHPFEIVGLPRPELGPLRLSGFFVGSASYNSRIQMVPEFAGGAPALADAGQVNFRFDKFGLGVSGSFAPWLSAGAFVEVESHRDRHSHGFNPAFGCPGGGGACIEQFGAEEAATEVVLDKFHITAIAPLGNGVAVSFGRFDVPFGFERHDEPLNLTATTSEVFQFGRPNRMTGFQAAYQVAPWLDVAGWVVNRWEAETTHDPFDDNNRDKSVGGRIGFTPFARDSLLNFGIGGFFGPEQTNRTNPKRWVLDLDVTWSPAPRLLIAAEAIVGHEDEVSMRRLGLPFPRPVRTTDADWWGFYALAHYAVVDWLGLTARYGLFDDEDGARTGVPQLLQSFTVAPIVHLSRLIPGLRPTGATYARSRLAINWVDVKLEYRFNYSDRPVFSDVRPGVPILDAHQTSQQLQLQFIVNW